MQRRRSDIHRYPVIVLSFLACEGAMFGSALAPPSLPFPFSPGPKAPDWEAAVKVRARRCSFGSFVRLTGLNNCVYIHIHIHIYICIHTCILCVHTYRYI